MLFLKDRFIISIRLKNFYFYKQILNYLLFSITNNPYSFSLFENKTKMEQILFLFLKSKLSPHFIMWTQEARDRSSTSTRHPTRLLWWMHETRWPHSRATLDSFETTATLVRRWNGIDSDSWVHIELDPLGNRIFRGKEWRWDVRVFRWKFSQFSFQSVKKTNNSLKEKKKKKGKGKIIFSKNFFFLY